MIDKIKLIIIYFCMFANMGLFLFGYNMRVWNLCFFSVINCFLCSLPLFLGGNKNGF